MASANSTDSLPTRKSAAPLPIVGHVLHPLSVDSARIRTATALPNSSSLIAVVGADQIWIDDKRVTTPAPVLALATARYVAVLDGGLPTNCTVLITLLEGQGLMLFSLPTLEAIETPQQLTDATKEAHHFAVDQLSDKSIADTFRVVVATTDRVILLRINVPKDAVEVLSETSTPESIVSLSFADMTVVATTVRNHCMLRIARSSNMAVAATVLRYDPNTRRRKNAHGDPGAAVMSFIGGFFTKKNGASINSNQLAFPLPDNRWVLSVDDEWVTYSAFGAKLEEMENVFKSRAAIDISESEVNAALSAVDNKSQIGVDTSAASSTSRLRRSGSVSSMASMTSVASTFTALTIVDEARASRSEKPAAVAVFASPFVLCLTDNNQLLAFAANGSIPGAIATLSIGEDEKNAETGASIVPCLHERCLALVYWPSGRIVSIHLTKDLDSLIEECEQLGELRNALALVPIDQVDRTITFRRKLAVEARQADWHDAAIHHMQQVVNLCIAKDGFGQLELIVEAIELRGARGSSWESDPITATLWADFLFRLRQRIMQPGPSDVSILQTLCRADTMSTRIKALFAVKHEVPMDEGEAAITAGDCALQEEERIEALVALYNSLDQHDNALVLLEKSGINRAFQTVCTFLQKNIRPDENCEVFFKHLQWVASESKQSRSREAQFISLITMAISQSNETEDALAERILQSIMRIVVEHTTHLLDDVINLMCPWDTCIERKEPAPSKGIRSSWLSLRRVDNTSKPDEKKSIAEEQAQEKGISRVEAEANSDKEPSMTVDRFAIALLAGMAKADLLRKEDMFQKLRELLQSRILHNDEATYNPEKLVATLQAEQNQAMSLHEELAFLLGRQGQHEAAAFQLAAEPSLSTLEAKKRLEKLLPVSDRGMSNQALVSAYLQVSGKGKPNRVECAAEVVRREGGFVDVEKVLKDLNEKRCNLTLSEMKPFIQAALISGKERQRIAEVIRAMRVSEVRRVRDQVLRSRRRCVLIGDERACSICTRRIDDSSVFAAYPDGTVTHLACHNVAMSSNRSQSSVPSARTE